MRAPWGKFDPLTGESHHLIHHSAHVAAVVHELLLLPGFRQQLHAAAGEFSCGTMVMALMSRRDAV